MNRFVKKVTQFLANDEGPTAVGYAMVVMLVALACLSAVVLLGQWTSTGF